MIQYHYLSFCKDTKCFYYSDTSLKKLFTIFAARKPDTKWQ